MSFKIEFLFLTHFLLISIFQADIIKIAYFQYISSCKNVI